MKLDIEFEYTMIISTLHELHLDVILTANYEPDHGGVITDFDLKVLDKRRNNLTAKLERLYSHELGQIEHIAELKMNDLLTDKLQEY